MMYEDLIKRLKVTCGDCKLWDGYKCCLKGECSAQTRLQAADAIEELSKAVLRLEDESGIYDELPTFYIYPAKWIPVTERLPETHGHYLAHIILGEYQQVSCDEIAYFDGKVFRWEHFGEEYPEEVTHWMPLPEPPKDGEE